MRTIKLPGQFIPKLLLSTLLLVTANSVNAQWGEGDSRTETRHDAGLQGNAGAKSGFFQTNMPSNFPAGAQNWWHLLDVRHSTTSNNFAMQFAGSFFDQGLYFRKTSGNPSQPWSQVFTASTDGVLNSNNNRIVIHSSDGQSLYTGRQVGATYSYPGGAFRAITDNPNGTVNYYFDGVTNGVRNFGVRADGLGYLAGGLGVRTTTPDAVLDVNGTFVVGGNSANIDPRSVRGNLSYLENTGRMLIGWNKTQGAGETDIISNQGTGNVGGFAFYNHGNTGIEKQLMWLTGDGSLLLGVNYNPNPNVGAYKLAVGGGIIAESVTVKLQSNWPDFVFNKTYELPSLSKVNEFITKNHHLPEIPSEKEVGEKGIDVGKMNGLLLKKIEELTLYLIEKDNEVKSQNKKLNSLQEQLDLLKKAFETARNGVTNAN